MAGRVLLVGDDHVFVHVFSTVLRQAFDTTTLESPGGVAEHIRTHGPYAVVVVDIRTPGADEFTVLEAAAKASPGSKKILVSHQPHLESVIAAINNAQISGILNQDCTPEELLAAVQNVLDSPAARKPLAPSQASDVLSTEERDFFLRGAE